MEKLSLPEDQKRGGNCGVTALAVSSGLPFTKVWQAFRKNNRWKGATYIFERHQVLKRLNIPFTSHERWNNLTVYEFMRLHAKKNRRYTITIKKHVITLMNDSIADQTGVFNIHESKYANSKIQNVTILNPDEEYLAINEFDPIEHKKAIFPKGVFRIGMRVFFLHGKRNPVKVFGKVTKVNKKTVMIVTDKGTTVRAHPTVLEVYNEVTEK